jgi:hypothetical protein
MRLARSAAALLLLVLTQCGGDLLPPYETVPPPVRTQGTHVAVCYNALTTSAAAVRAVAAASCGADMVPHPVGHDLSLSNCPLLLPARATFACRKS